MIATVAASRSVGRQSPKLLLASVALATPGWCQWALVGGSLLGPVTTSVVLLANVGVTRWLPTAKRRVATALQRYGLNPLVRGILALGVLPLGICLLETTGRVSGRTRRTPVGDGRIGRTCWIVAEHGRAANYVRNIEASAHVRVRCRTGRSFRPAWHDGVARVLCDDDPYRRQRQICRWHPLRALNAALVRAWGTDLVTIRVDLVDLVEPAIG